MFGDRPLQPSNNIKGVPQHARTSSPIIASSQAKTSKKALNLLNPVNLLMRRRSQPSPTESVKSNTNKRLIIPPMDLPADYDPRIKGSIIHDFSNSKGLNASPSYQNTGSSSTGSSPMIQSPSNLSRNDRILSDSTSGHIFQQMHSYDRTQYNMRTPSPMANKSMPRDEGEICTDSLENRYNSDPDISPVSSSQDIAWEMASTPSPIEQSPILDTLRHRSTNAGSPIRVRSDASRFSFQLTNDAAIEDALVEERAKHESLISDSHVYSNTGAKVDDEEEEFFDENAMYDADELEGQGMEYERDLEHDEMNAFASALPPADDYGNFDVFNHHLLQKPLSATISATSPTDESCTTPSVTGLGLIYEDHTYSLPGVLSSLSTSNDFNEKVMSNDRNDSHQGIQSAFQRPLIQSSRDDHNLSRASHDFDDDIYFQSNYSGNVSDQISGGRDEYRKTNNLLAYHDALVNAANEAAKNGRFTRTNSRTSDFSDAQPSSDNRDSHNPSSLPTRIRDSYSGFDFGFDDSDNNEIITDENENENEHVSVGNIQAHRSTTSSLYSQVSHFPADHETEQYHDSSFPSDDADEDYDNIIAEANASALANDSDGFYGREFGNDALSYADSNMGGIERKWSVREPNLTPITERSEFSTRNSYTTSVWNSPALGNGTGVSFGNGNDHRSSSAMLHSRSSPFNIGYMHEADCDDIGEDMSLEQILRLRNLAFGDGAKSVGAGSGRTESVSSLSSSGGAYICGVNNANIKGHRLTHSGSWSVGYGGSRLRKEHILDETEDSEEIHSSTRQQSSQTESPMRIRDARSEAEYVDSNFALETPRKPMCVTAIAVGQGDESPQAPLTAIKNSSKGRMLFDDVNQGAEHF